MAEAGKPERWGRTRYTALGRPRTPSLLVSSADAWSLQRIETISTRNVWLLAMLVAHTTVGKALFTAASTW
eukprot:357554-Chlamydomonas_euryale.AAC.3